MQYILKYGKGKIALSLPENANVTVVDPRHAQPLEDPLGEFSRALNSPLSCLRFEDMTPPGSIAIAVPDETRPFPTKLLLPPLLEKIFRTYPDLPHERVSIVVGGGLHPRPDGAQLARILPEDLRGCRVVSHDALTSPMRHMGVTSRGTPVEINAAYADADLKIVMGMVDIHQFVGCTGGAKGVVVGCASANMITHSHSMMTRDEAYAGNIATNPVRLDMNEAGEIAGVRVAVNVVLTSDKKIAALFVGSPVAVLEKAALMTKSLYGQRLEKPFDIVIASCGGYPKDICLYQAQKALDACRHCVSPHGKILLLAQCAQGIGDERYEKYVERFHSQEELMENFRHSEFVMGAHKAFLFARAALNHEVILHTDLSESDLARCLLRKGDAQTAIDAWLDGNPKMTVGILTYANSTFFLQD